MKKLGLGILGLLFIGAASVGCSQQGSDSADLGNPAGDGGATGDQGTTGGDGGSASGPVWTQLALLAGGLGGPGNIDGVGSAARFQHPDDLISDGAGHLYVADEYNDLIRRIDIASGLVTTIAGTPGRSGAMDGIGTAASLSAPYALALDGQGSLYVADGANCLIRRITLATLAVTTVAGSQNQMGSADGIGMAARFNLPEGIAADASGSVYIADSFNHTIRKFDAATSAVTTIAGAAGTTGTTDGAGTVARFNRPSGILLDGLGNLYIADNQNCSIRKMVLSSGMVSTVAGTSGSCGPTDGTGSAALFHFPGSLALDGMGNMYVADTGNGTIRKIVLSSGVVTTIAGSAINYGSTDGVGSAARFQFPVGITSDGAGNLFISDTSNHTIRKLVINTNTVSTFAGSITKTAGTDGTGAVARFKAPAGVATDGAGNAYVTDTSNHLIRKVVIATGVVTTLAGTVNQAGFTDGTGATARFNTPSGAALDGAGNLYVADNINGTVRKIVVATGAVTTLAGTALMTGSLDGNGAAARFNRPLDVAADSAGNLYVADTNNRTIRKIVLATGDVTTFAGTAGMGGLVDGVGTAARFNNPTGLATDNQGNLYVSEYSTHVIRKIVLATATVSTVAGQSASPGSKDGVGINALFRNPQGLATDNVGNLYVADSANALIRKVDPQSRTVTTLIGTVGQFGVKLAALPAALNKPTTLVVTAAGELLITDATENAVLLAR